MNYKQLGVEHEQLELILRNIMSKTVCLKGLGIPKSCTGISNLKMMMNAWMLGDHIFI